MFGAAMGVLGGSLSSGFSGGGLSGAARSMQQLVADKQTTMDSYTNPAAAVVGAPAGLAGGGATSAPVIPMSDSYTRLYPCPILTTQQLHLLFSPQKRKIKWLLCLEATMKDKALHLGLNKNLKKK